MFSSSDVSFVLVDGTGRKEVEPWYPEDGRTRLIILGNPERITVGNGLNLVRPPYPFLDLTGSLVKIGEEVVLSSGVYVHTHTHQFGRSDWRDKPPVGSNRPTVLDDYCFVGVNAQLMHTCKRVGRHSVVAAGSIVTGDVPDYEVWAGNPARKIGDVQRSDENL